MRVKARGYLVHHGVVLDPCNDARTGILNQGGTWGMQY
jgi:hypothetical protein